MQTNITIKPNSQPASQPSQNNTIQNNQFKTPGTGSVWFKATLLVAIIAVIAAVIILVKYKVDNKKSVAVAPYQAVFLTNGQVYFGKLSDINGEYVTLTDIYYLQLDQQLQPGSGNQQTQPQQDQPKLQLVKLGNELHGPTDMMKISRSQILFYEYLKENSKVIQAISNYKLTGGQTSTQTEQQKQQQQQSQQQPPQQQGQKPAGK